MFPVFGAIATSVVLVGAATVPAANAAAPDHAMGETTVVVDPALYAFLLSAGVSVAPTGSATAEAFEDTVAAVFSITDITMDGNKLAHSGGLDFSAGEVNIEAKRYVIRLDLARVTAKVVGSEVGDAGRVPIFKIKDTDQPHLGAVKLVLTDTAAGALNATFGIDDFVKGATFGYATPEPEELS